jgi:hypothetical protein
MPELPRVTSCRSCLAGIRWVTFDTGNRNPIDAEPSEDGNIVQLADGRWHVLRATLAIGPFPRRAGGTASRCSPCTTTSTRLLIGS